MGSVNRTAALHLESAARACGRDPLRLVVVGGAPASWKQLRASAMAHIHLRLVDGVRRRTAAEARYDLKWADLVLIWGPTILAHRVSGLYFQGAGADRTGIAIVQRRGVAALLNTAAENVRQKQLRSSRRVVEAVPANALVRREGGL